MTDALGWIDALQLRGHPEGGWFREIYRSNETVPQSSLPSRFSGNRRFSTAIYFLLEESDFSALHRLQQDELWHFYDGGKLTIHVIDPAGHYSAIGLGRNVETDEQPMAVVKAGCLFGATVETKTFSLVGCTAAPGFEFKDFELPSRAELLEQYPRHGSIIERLTR